MSSWNHCPGAASTGFVVQLVVVALPSNAGDALPEPLGFFVAVHPACERTASSVGCPYTSRSWMAHTLPADVPVCTTFRYRAHCQENDIEMNGVDPVPEATGDPHVEPSFETYTSYPRG
jgi:hypothetical protein